MMSPMNWLNAELNSRSSLFSLFRPTDTVTDFLNLIFKTAIGLPRSPQS